MLGAGSTIGRYVVKRKLAEGGMAEVYLASAVGPEGFAKDVVLKVVRSFLANDKQFVDMFIAEARLSSKLNHANIVQIFDFGRADESYFLAMEYVRGVSLWELRSRCRERGIPFPPTLAAEIVAQVARALNSAHSATDRGQPLNLVHRDVTPHNVLLGFEGAVKLTDFGIAKASTTHTAPGILKGKFAYMSPEQARGDQLDGRSDLFALGIVLWELLTGGRLFDGDSEIAVLRAVGESSIVPPHRLNPDVPMELSDLTMKALSRPREERFQSAFEFERALSMFVLKTAQSVEESSVALFLSLVFPEESARLDDDATPSATVSALPLNASGVWQGEVAAASKVSDSVGHSATMAVDRSHERRQAIHAQQTKTTPITPRRELTDAVPSLMPDDEEVGPKTKPMPGIRASKRLPEVGPLEAAPAPSESNERAGNKPSTEVFDRKSGKISGRLPAPLQSPSRLPPMEPSVITAPLPVDSGTAVKAVRRSRTPMIVGISVAALVVAGAVTMMSRQSAVVAPVEQAEPLPKPSVVPVAAVPTAAAPEPVAVPAAPDASEPAPSPVVVAAVPVSVEESPAQMAAVQEKPKPELVAASESSKMPAAKRTAVVVAQGVVEIRATPFGKLSIDGAQRGEVEGVKTVKLPVGKHAIVLSHPRRTKRFEIVVSASETVRVVFEPLNGQ